MVRTPGTVRATAIRLQDSEKSVPGNATGTRKMLGFDVGAQPPGIQVPVGSNGRKRVPLLQKPTVLVYVSYSRTTKRISSSRNSPSMIHPHHCSKILFQNEDSHSKTFFGTHVIHYHHQNTGWSIPTYGSTDKTYQQQQERSRKIHSPDDSTSSLQ